MNQLHVCPHWSIKIKRSNQGTSKLTNEGALMKRIGPFWTSLAVVSAIVFTPVAAKERPDPRPDTIDRPQKPAPPKPSPAPELPANAEILFWPRWYLDIYPDVKKSVGADN